MFKVGDRVVVTPTSKMGWINEMERYVGSIGVVSSTDDDYYVVFKDKRGYFYVEGDLAKVNKFKGNK